MQQITNALPHSTVQPMRQNVAAEEQILGHTRGLLYLATIVISLLVAMSVLTTLTASVIERRKDFAVMKALGASQRELMSMFLFEAVTQAAIGGLAGYILGTLVAAWIGKANFGAIVSPQLQLFIPVLAGTLLIAALSALLPLNILRHVEPAAILKGE